MTSREPSAAQLILGDVLQRTRKSAGLSQDQLATLTNYSRSQISMAETGQLLPSPDFVTRCDDALETGGLLAGIHRRASSEDATARVAELAKAEELAAAIRSYNPVLVPGLLQTEGYMRHLLGAGRFSGVTDEEIDERVAVRLRRQRVLAKLRSYLTVLDEAVLRRVIGNQQIMIEQLDHLLKLARSPRITIQIMPFEKLAYPAAGPMAILDLADGGQAVHLDGPVSGLTTSRPGIVGACTERYEMLRSQAVSVPESVRMIQERMEELDARPRPRLA